MERRLIEGPDETNSPTPGSPDRSRVVIVGAGLAGLATARELTKRGRTDVWIVEQETAAGSHSSGRNAAMVRQVVPDPELARLARKGARFLRESAKRWDIPDLVQQHGSVLIGGGRAARMLQDDASDARANGLAVESWDSTHVDERVPVAASRRPRDGHIAIFNPSDGVVDVHALVSGLLRESIRRGARFLPRRRVLDVLTDDDGRVAGVETDTGRILASSVVNAAGAWAGEIGRMAQAVDVPLSALRRHLFYTGRWDHASSDWPFVWDVEHDVYFRPESDGLLLSPCDETIHAPGVPDVDHDAAVLLGEKLAVAFPALAELPIARSWAGLRTFATDHRFVIGPDPLVEGFHWVAALGGHGVTTAGAVGALAAETLLEPRTDVTNPFSPSRFLTSADAAGCRESSVRAP